MILKATIDPVFNKNPYQTVAGYVELGIRFVCMIWFVIELKETFNHLVSAAVRNTNSSGAKTVSSLPRQENDMDETDSDDDEYVVVNKGKVYARLNSDQDQERPSRPGVSANYLREERLRSYQKFYLHFGACCLVWFIYLPVLICVTSFVSELFRLRLVLSKS
jgi:hypothetical protein